jgi:hypothetical protein
VERVEEHFVEIDGLYPYAVSNYGTVINVNTDKELKQFVDKQGYHRVTLYRTTVEGESKKYCIYVHRFVAMAFFLNYQNGIEVLHINEDKSDNSVLNLTLGGLCREAAVDVREASS